MMETDWKWAENDWVVESLTQTKASCNKIILLGQQKYSSLVKNN